MSVLDAPTGTAAEEHRAGRGESRPVAERFIPLPSSPGVRVPVRTKITLPYMLLALLFALGAALIATQVVVDSIEDRFQNQLLNTGVLAADWMVQEEDRLLDTLRLLAFTEGVPEAVSGGDAERLRSLALPLAINNQVETVEVLAPNGQSLLSLRHRSGGNLEEFEWTQGGTLFTQADFAGRVLDQELDDIGDKHAGVATIPDSRGRATPYFYVAGPLVDSDGDLVGAVLVGQSLRTLVRQIREATLAGQTTLYASDGQPIFGTANQFGAQPLSLPEADAARILEKQDDSSHTRDWTLGSTDYTEIVGPWESRHGEDMGLMGSALGQNFVTNIAQNTRWLIFALSAGSIFLVLVIGVLLAGRITSPLLRVVQASQEVAQGNLDIQLQPTGRDEIADLTNSFNFMVSRLQEGSLYRDLLGRTVSPEVRDQLRQTFLSGQVSLEGQNATATVLISDIHGFTAMSEPVDPATVLTWLNEYFSELLPTVADHGGVVSTFEGDSMLAFFGLLPRPMSSSEGALQACLAAVKMLQRIQVLNELRQRRGDPPLITGIGVNTGLVTAGALGSTDRLQYTVIGDTVNTTQRLEDFTRRFGGSSIVVSQFTVQALGTLRNELNFESMGRHRFSGKADALPVYRLWPPQDPTPPP